VNSHVEALVGGRELELIVTADVAGVGAGFGVVLGASALKVSELKVTAAAG